MPQASKVFAISLLYVKEAYRILGVKDPPPVAVLIHGICSKADHCSVSELADTTGLSLKTTSRALGQIRRLGLIELRICQHDTRVKYVHLTRRGREIERGLYQNLLGLAREIHALMN